MTSRSVGPISVVQDSACSYLDLTSSTAGTSQLQYCAAAIKHHKHHQHVRYDVIYSYVFTAFNPSSTLFDLSWISCTVQHREQQFNKLCNKLKVYRTSAASYATPSRKLKAYNRMQIYSILTVMWKFFVKMLVVHGTTCCSTILQKVEVVEFEHEPLIGISALVHTRLPFKRCCIWQWYRLRVAKD